MTRWFRISLVETDFPTTLVGPDGQPVPAPRIRVPASHGVPYNVPFAHSLHSARGASSLDALIGVRSASFAAPGDWAELDMDSAKLAFKEIMGVEPLAGQVS